MDNLDTSKDKIQKICDILKNEAIDPAKSERDKIVKDAQNQAQKMISDAEKKAAQLIEKAQKEIEKERQLSKNQLQQAVVQAKAKLKEQVEKEFFSTSVQTVLEKPLQDTKLGASIVQALVKAIEKEGISSDFAVVISEKFSKSELVKSLASSAAERVKKEPITLGAFHGGVKVILKDKNMTLDLSDQAVNELVGSLVRKEFREFLFQDDA